jgi:hypothetical protein
MNLYGFVGNNGVSKWDYLGMEEVPGPYNSEREAAEAAGTEGMKKSHKEWEDGVERAKKNKIPFLELPKGPREYGGRICVKCIIEEDGSKTFTEDFTYTIDEGEWVKRNDFSASGKIALNLTEKCPDGWELFAFWHIHPGVATRVLGTDDAYEFVYDLGGDFSTADKQGVDGHRSKQGNWIIPLQGKGLWLTRYVRTKGKLELEHKKYSRNKI